MPISEKVKASIIKDIKNGDAPCDIAWRYKTRVEIVFTLTDDLYLAKETIYYMRPFDVKQLQKKGYNLAY